ncbi:MAG: type II toxin-antitoxin system HicA family toxin [Blastocatellia bacterium]
MKAVSGKEFAKILERHGWSLLRVQGSHHIYSVGKLGATFDCLFPFTAIARSKRDCKAHHETGRHHRS